MVAKAFFYLYPYGRGDPLKYIPGIDDEIKKTRKVKILDKVRY
jgi:hypothetical protein